MLFSLMIGSESKLRLKNEEATMKKAGYFLMYQFTQFSLGNRFKGYFHWLD